MGGGNNGGTATSFTIGGNNIANDFSALTLTSGTLISAGTISAAGPAGSPGVNNFNFMGGTLAAAGVDVTHLGSISTATATANQTNSSDNIGILVNYGGTLAPGGDGSVGKTLITGAYAVSNNAAVLAIDIGGTNRATTFQTNALDNYDYVQVSTNITLGGSLKVSLAAGFVPTATQQFNIVTVNTGGIVSGTFTNLAAGSGLGRVTVANMTNATFAVIINSLTNTVYLYDFQVASATPAPVASFSGTPVSGVRPLTVNFTNSSTGSFTNGLWDFGDGNTTNTSALNLSHIYTQAGTFNVQLIAQGVGGSGTNTQNSYIIVSVPQSPKFGSATTSGSSLILQGTNGPTGGGYYYWLLSSTNLTIPLSSWSIIATNPFNADGSFSNSIPFNPAEPNRFYSIQMP